MASLLLLLRSVAVMSPARFLPGGVASRSFFSWLPGHLQTASLWQTHPTPKLHAADLSPFLRGGPLPSLQPVAGMKCKTVLRKRCKDCFFVRRRGRLYVYCKTHPRHKQRQL